MSEHISDEQLAEAVAAGEVSFDFDAAGDAKLLTDLPPRGAPVTVVRPVRLPYETDAMIKALAEARGRTMSELIREWITIGLAAAGQVPDPVHELRLSLDTAQRALDALTRRPPSAA
ncbi:MAG: CopG family transcriptional regulator [Micromonosporaceae bacterium]